MRKSYTYLIEILRLAGPIVVSYIAVGLMGVVDTLIVGNYSTDELAYMGLANAIFAFLCNVPMALLQGVSIKSSQKFGARKFSSCGKIYNEGKKYLIYLSIIFTLIGLMAKPLLQLLGQDAQMTENTTPLLIILSISIPFVLIYTNINFFLQSIKRPHVAMYGIIFANVINLLINPVLVYGKFGVPAMGADGAAVTTLIIRIVLAIYLMYYVSNMQKKPKLKKRFGLDRKFNTWYYDSKSTRKIGYGIAIIVIAQVGSFTLVNVFASWLGELAMASFVIMANINVFLFMTMFALSQAVSIVAANTYGKKDVAGLRKVLKSSYCVYFLGILLLELILYFFSENIYSVFTKDAEIMNIIRPLLYYMMIDIFIDSLPLNLVAVLNARGDVKIPSINQVVSFLGFRVVCTYILMFVFNLGLMGLWLGLACGGLSSLILNYIRYFILTKRDKILA